jgi:DNA-binding IclR family transcriptional regulator
VHTRVGLHFPLHASGAGLVLLAFAPNDVQESVLSAPLERFTTKTITDSARLRAVLAETRRSDVAISDGQVTLDSLSVGAPVRDASGVVVAAVSIVVHAGTQDVSLLAPLVLTAARGISRSLAGSSALRQATALPASVRTRREPG